MLGEALTGWGLRCRDQESSKSARDEPFLCFQRRARGDVVLESLSEGVMAEDGASHHDHKILGSAQRRHRGAVLQHGSLLLRSSPAAPEVAGLGDLVAQDVSPETVSPKVARHISADLQLSLSPEGRSPEVESNAVGLANTKYAAATWTKRR
jgi:lipoate-protein ligase A